MQNTTKLTALLQAALVLTGIGNAQTNSPRAVKRPARRKRRRATTDGCTFPG